MLTAEIRKHIMAGHGDRKLAEILSTPNMPVTRHQARKYIELFKVEQATATAKPAPASNRYHAETREEWTMRLQGRLESKFAAIGYPLPERIRIGFGFPSGGKRSTSLAECWKSEVSKDETFEIFMNPRLPTAVDPGEWIVPGHEQYLPGDLVVAATIVHENIHACLWSQGKENHGHGPEFKAVAKDLGLVILNTRTGSTTATPELVKELQEILDDIGPLPMAPLQTGVDVKEPQTTRQLLLICPDNPDYKVRMARGPIEEYGLPHGPTRKRMLIDKLSMLKTEYLADQIVSLGYAVRNGKALEITELGSEHASQLIEELLDGKDVARVLIDEDELEGERQIRRVMAAQR